MLNYLSYLSYLFKYVILYVVFELYLLIKYIIIFNFLNKINGQMQFKKSTVTIKKIERVCGDTINIYSGQGPISCIGP
jgi:hypothetical protein